MKSAMETQNPLNLASTLWVCPSGDWQIWENSQGTCLVEILPARPHPGEWPPRPLLPRNAGLWTDHLKSLFSSGWKLIRGAFLFSDGEAAQALFCISRIEENVLSLSQARCPLAGNCSFWPR